MTGRRGALRRLLLPALVLIAAAACPSSRAQLQYRPAPDEARSVLLIGWDGTQRGNLKKLLAAGQLPNLRRLIREGALADITVGTGGTHTKPGWAEILSGYSSVGLLGIFDNKDYRPIPKGCTIFEMLKKRFGDKIQTVFLGGKDYNIGARGPHRDLRELPPVRDPKTGEETYWWDEARYDGFRWPMPYPATPQWVLRAGEPFANATGSIDYHKLDLGPADQVGPEALAVLDRLRGEKFFAFVHFEEPDEQGHRYSDSSPQYAEALRAADLWLGKLTDKLRGLGLYDKTWVFVVSDHGMCGNNHQFCPEVFLATNHPGPLRDGDRKDITPTVLQALGVDPAGIAPELDGRSLLAPAS